MNIMLFHMYDTTNDFWWTQGEWIYNLGRDLAKRRNLPARFDLFMLPAAEGEALEALMKTVDGYDQLPGPVYIEKTTISDFYARFPSFLQEKEPEKSADKN